MWTTAEENKLIGIMSDMTIAQIAKAMGRTYWSISYKLKELKSRGVIERKPYFRKDMVF